MTRPAAIRLPALLIILQLIALPALAQGSAADYERAQQLRDRFRGTVTQQTLEPVWVGEGESFWFRTDTGRGAGQWIRVASATGEQQPAFDHDKLAAALGEAAGQRIDPARLPLNQMRVGDDEASVGFSAFDKRWDYALAIGELTEREDNPDNASATERRARAQRREIWRRRTAGGRGASPDGRWVAEITNHNLIVRPAGEGGANDTPPTTLTTDGTEDDGYIPWFFWSPDSTKLVVMKRRAGDERRVTIIDSSPDDQLQPKTDSYFYLKPGDQVPVDRPHLFDLQSMTEVPVADNLAPNPYALDSVRWWADSSAFTYEYNQRGHQTYRVIAVDAATGESRAVISEEPQTFFCYSSKKYLNYLDETGELIWMSERDGWNHLYLYDGETGRVKSQITRGEWVVRSVERVDEEARLAWVWACGVHPGQDPYNRHYGRVHLDTGELTMLTESPGDHTAVSVSPNGQYLVTTWSTVDQPPVHELRSAETGELIKEIARADASALIEAGWIAPEPFAAKGRDGETDIYGYLVKPTNFDETKQYPVIEYIYAGPHDQHVEKRFYEIMRIQQLAELGFIVVRIDGMGTNWRSKAFHDVCWKNLKDAGFPDRIAWMKAAAETRPWMDISRVGIYGGSAGGQNAMRAVLDYADFYKAAAADCGCHDNRMDKIWWNEQWMGYPVDQSYIDSSNVVDAHKLGGALLLTVGELDHNVDPASTMQVVDELIKAGKDFELIVFPGADHGAGGGPYGTRRLYDFFVRNLYGREPRWE